MTNSFCKNMVVSHQKRAFGVFSSRQETEQALDQLKASGFPMDKVSIIAKQTEQDAQLSGVQMSDRVGEKNIHSTTGVVADTTTGAAWGTVLVGLTSLAIPGIGPVLAAGTLGVALLAGVAGTALSTANIGGLVKALTELGIPEQQAKAYGDRLIQSDYLVIVDGTDDEIRTAETMLSKQAIQGWGVFEAPTASGSG